MNKSLIVTTAILLFVLIVFIFVFLFWRLGILKKEPAPSSKIIEIKEKIDYIQNYPFNTVIDYLKDLSLQKIEIPQINPEEIGRENLF